MAGRSWATSIFTAIGVAAGAGAAQLGFGYGLGIISWQPVNGGATVWVNSLAWVTWLAATSTVIGAMIADRLSGFTTPGAHESFGAHAIAVAWRFVIALSAAVGALITVPLVALPARTPRPDNVAPYFTTGGYAVAGVIVGLVVALGALTARAITANVIASTAWVWTLAGVAVADVVRGNGDVAGSAQLATWQFTNAQLVRGMINLPGALLMLAIALVVGGLAAWPAGRRGDNRVGVAISGAAGPLLVAAAYFFAAPTVGDQHLSAFVMAPYAVLAGLAGSVLVAAIGPKGARTEARAKRRAEEDERNRRAADEMTDWTKALAAADERSRRDEEAADAAELSESSEPKEPKPISASPTTYGTPKPAPKPTPKSTPSATSTPVKAAAKPADVQAAEPAKDSARDSGAKELDEDSYASSRAYAEDTVEPEPVSSGSSSPVTGRASVEPLWPSQPEAKETPAPKKPRRNR
jgi:hypothetical protein